MKVHLVFACNESNIIGERGNHPLPWHYSEDLKNFKSVTSGGVMLMGRSTFDSMGVLPNRLHFVLTSNPEEIVHDKVIAKSSLEELMVELETMGIKEIYVIGGGGLLNKFMNSANTIYRTLIKNHRLELKDPVVLSPIDMDKYYLFINKRGVENPNLNFQVFKLRGK